MASRKVGKSVLLVLVAIGVAFNIAMLFLGIMLACLSVISFCYMGINLLGVAFVIGGLMLAIGGFEGTQQSSNAFIRAWKQLAEETKNDQHS